TLKVDFRIRRAPLFDEEAAYPGNEVLGMWRVRIQIPRRNRQSQRSAGFFLPGKPGVDVRLDTMNRRVAALLPDFVKAASGMIPQVIAGGNQKTDKILQHTGCAIIRHQPDADFRHVLLLDDRAVSVGLCWNVPITRVTEDFAYCRP